MPKTCKITLVNFCKLIPGLTMVRASDPESIILVFSPNGVMWVAGFVSEKRDSLHFPYHPTKLLNRETYAFKTGK
jgi:hypothetical protein